MSDEMKTTKLTPQQKTFVSIGSGRTVVGPTMTFGTQNDEFTVKKVVSGTRERLGDFLWGVSNTLTKEL